MKALIALLTVLIVSACSENDIPTPPHLLIPAERDAQADELRGVWLVEDVAPGCDELVDFGQAVEGALASESPDKLNMRIRSRDEVLLSGYEQTPEFERDQLSFNIKSDTGGEDCVGNSAFENFGVDDVTNHQLFGPLYIEREENSAGDVTLTLHPTATSAEVVTEMTFVPQDLSPAVDGPESLSIVALTPDEAREGVTTSFVINISYETNEVIPADRETRPRIEVGLNNLFRDDYEVLRTETAEIGGPRELLLLIEGEPLIWGNDNTYAVQVAMFDSLGEEVARVYQPICVYTTDPSKCEQP